MSTSREISEVSAAPPDGVFAAVPVLPYEQRIAKDWKMAMEQGDAFFAGRSEVLRSLEKIVRRLEQYEIPYAVAGGLSLIQYGYVRFTDDIDLLVTRNSLQLIHEQFEGLGYVRLFVGSKGLRDAETGVKIDFILTGDFPGDGQPKDISFPDPASAAEIYNGIRFLTLPALISLKIASGATGAGRAKDIGDVEQLILARKLPEDFARELHPAMQDPFRKIWRKVYRLEKHIRIVLPGDDPQILERMLAAGIVVDTSRTLPGGRLLLTTSDPVLAAKFDMHPADEFFIDNSGDVS